MEVKTPGSDRACAPMVLTSEEMQRTSWPEAIRDRKPHPQLDEIDVSSYSQSAAPDGDCTV